MKLITEHIEDGIEILNEGAGKKDQYISGVFMQAEQKNRNQRIYPRNVLENAVNIYNDTFVKTNRAGGELNHPEGPIVNPERISHRITELNWNGNDVYGKALILNTPMGQIVKGLIEGGIKLGVSSRGMGTIENKNGQSFVKSDFRLSTVDIVYDPSAPSAFVDGIMEGVEWIWDNGILKAQQVVETYETEIKKATSKQLGELQSKLFEDFLSKIN